MAISLLMGNGINRLTNNDASWESVLQELASGPMSGAELAHMKHKPFALVYEEILLTHMSSEKAENEALMKATIAERVGALASNGVHRRVMESRVKHILTTNYDYAFERAVRGTHAPSYLRRENKYSVFRRRAVGDKSLWHIHGEVDVPNSITLGYDQYAGYLQNLRAWATAERHSKRKGSPFKVNVLDFDTTGGVVYSWLDVFFRDDIHIVGLGLDYTEIDLWWALTYKARLKARGYQVGKTVFHDWSADPLATNACDSPVRELTLAKRSLLEALSVEVAAEDWEGDYLGAYEAFIKQYLDPLPIPEALSR